MDTSSEPFNAVSDHSFVVDEQERAESCYLPLTGVVCLVETVNEDGM